MNYEYQFSELKNLRLKNERGISFEDVINAIEKENILDIVPHYNQRDYPNQKILIIEIKRYVYLVPFLEEDVIIYLKTIIPSRKFTKLYLER